MQETLEYWLVVAVARALGWMPRRLRVCLPGLAWSVYHSLGRLRRVGERNLSLALPRLPPAERARDPSPSLSPSGWQLVEFCRMPRYTPRKHPALDAHRRPGALSGRAKPRKGRAGAHRPSGRMGALQLLPLADGPSHGHGHPPSRQPPPRRIRQRHPLPARQPRAAQRRLSPAAC